MEIFIDKMRAMVLQAEEMATWKAKRAEEGRKLERERATLNRQARALVKLPTKKERAEVRSLTYTVPHGMLATPAAGC